MLYTSLQVYNLIINYKLGRRLEEVHSRMYEIEEGFGSAYPWHSDGGRAKAKLQIWPDYSIDKM